MISSIDLIRLAGLGVNLSINAKTVPVIDIIKVAGIIKMKEAKLTLTNANAIPAVDLIRISGLLNGNLTLDFNN